MPASLHTESFEQWLTRALQENRYLGDSAILTVADAKLSQWLKDWPYPLVLVEASEEAKSLPTVERIYRFLDTNHATRSSVLVCIGGGMITDTGGFAAATYKRGMRCIYVPTTLLSMVDASHGGKVGVNFNGVKNEIGLFREPDQVFICPSLLQSLPMRERLSGYAEMLKHALIADKTEWIALLRFLDADGLSSLDDPLRELIERSLAIKRAICLEDPLDHDKRQALNFGHTVGHALEALSLRRDHPLPHGFAVMQGMVAALYLSVKRLGCPSEVLRQAGYTMVEHYGRAVCPCKEQDELLRLMYSDKKNERGDTIHFTLLRDIGQPVTRQAVPEEEIREALEYLFSL